MNAKESVSIPFWELICGPSLPVSRGGVDDPGDTPRAGATDRQREAPTAVAAGGEAAVGGAPSARRGGDKTLFTPGPLTTSPTVKQAMLRDLGSRDREFMSCTRRIRRRLLEVAGVAEPHYTAVLMQGSGTFALESVIASVTPPQGKWLVASNGAYGRRIALIARTLGIATTELVFADDERVSPLQVAAVLAEDPKISHVAAVHCETTTGILNPISEIGDAVQRHGAVYMVDAMSSFGAVPLDPATAGVQFMVSSANKCLEGVPGISLVVASRPALEATAGWARSVSLDLLAQLNSLDDEGQFRFTPPTQVLLALEQALIELEAEGGPAGRAARYAANRRVLMAGMESLGFRPYLRGPEQSHIIQTFRYPQPKFDFARFYDMLSDAGYLIYPGKSSATRSFRIGTIGRVDTEDMQALVDAVAEALARMNR